MGGGVGRGHRPGEGGVRDEIKAMSAGRCSGFDITSDASRQDVHIGRAQLY